MHILKLPKFLISGLIFSISCAHASIPQTQINAPNIKAKTYLLIDANSNKVLAQKNIDKKVDPASLTKMMTMYVVDQELKQGKLNEDDLISISKKAWQAPGSRMFVEVGSKVPVKELIKGIIIQSGNDASIAIAEHIAGTESAFAELMNGYAQILGMNNSHFMNATGLTHEEHYSTANDMAILAKAIIRDFPETYKIYSEKSFSYKGIKQYNRNRLLWRNSTVDGIKTGYTDKAGFCLVSSGVLNDMRLISVILGARTDDGRTNESHKLLSWGFRFFETHKLYNAPESLQDIKIWQGKADLMPIGLDKNIFVTIPQGQYRKLNASLSIPNVIKAPIKAGDTIGSYKITRGEEIILEEPVIALKSIKKGGLWKQFKDKIVLSTNALWEKMKS